MAEGQKGENVKFPIDFFEHCLPWSTGSDVEVRPPHNWCYTVITVTLLCSVVQRDSTDSSHVYKYQSHVYNLVLCLQAKLSLVYNLVPCLQAKLSIVYNIVPCLQTTYLVQCLQVSAAAAKGTLP